MMKKIVYIVEAFGGGVLAYLSELAEGLMNDYDISILYGQRPQTPKDLTAYFGAQVHLYEIKYFTRELNPYKDLRAYLEIKKYLRIIKPNIIHLNSSKAGALGRLMRYQKGQKVFYTPHGYSFLMHSRYSIKSLFYLCLEKILGFYDAKTIAVGKGEYEQSLRVTKNSTYINNGVNTKLIDELSAVNDVDSNCLVTVGRIDVQKNPQIFNRLAFAFPQRQFVWIGDGPLKSELTAPNIKVLGWLPHKRVLAILLHTHLFLLLSQWEGLPISLLEAMYCKNCCIVTNVIGNRDIIKSKDNGIIINDFKQLTEAIKVSNGQISNISNNAANDILANYTLQQMVSQYCCEYER
ncbi:MAG: glycosyltransferase [Bombilactobacillus sp.]